MTDDPEPTRPAWDASGIHGLHRVAGVGRGRRRSRRRSSRASAPSSSRSPRGELVVEEGPDDVEPLAAPVERELAPPYRAEAVRRDGDLWAVAARAIEVVELPGRRRRGDRAHRRTADERTLVVDGEPAFGSIPALERPEHVVARAPDRRRRLGGRGRAALDRRAPPGRAGASRYPVGDARHRLAREVPSLRRRPAHEAAARSRPRTSRRSSPSSRRSPTTSCARRRSSSASGSTTARSSTTSSSRPTPPSARRACASPTSACSTCR